MKYIVLFLFLLFLDLFSKYYVLNFISDSMTLIPFIDLLVTSNTGIAFSLFSSSDQTVKIILILVTSLALLFLGNEFRNAKSLTYKYALTLIISGGFGNLFERILRGEFPATDASSLTPCYAGLSLLVIISPEHT